MSPVSALVVYILIWWVTLFGILPIGVRGQAEDGKVIKGTDPGAPVESQMKKKFILTTIVATVIWAIVCVVIISGIIDLKPYSFYTGE